MLCGVRDVRDYRIVLSNQDIVTGGSAFNIKSASLRLGDFTKDEIHELFISVDEGHLIIFDRSQSKSWEERIRHRPYQQGSHTIMVWGM